jgi:AraC-like DNA-binding protein
MQGPPARRLAFRYFAPSPDLAGLVAFHYIIEAGPAAIAEPVCALLGQVQFGIAGTGGYALGGGLRVVPDIAVVAPTDRAAVFRASRGYVAAGSGLTPAGWAAAIDASASMPGGLCDGRSVLDAAAAAHARVGCAPTHDARIAVLDRFMADRLATPRAIDPRIAAIDRWIVGGAPGNAAALAAELGLSRRSLERLTATTHGATPKLLAAKYRTLMAAARIAVGLADWRDPAVLGAFADQSHFIREFKRFVGITPRRFKRDGDSLVAQLVRGRWEPGHEPGIAIWNG